MSISRRQFISFAIGAILISTGMSVPNLASANELKVALVMPGVRTDKSFNQAAYEGLVGASKKLDVKYAYSESVSQPDQVQALSTYAQRGYDVVIANGGEWQDATARVAARFPKTTFVVVNGTKSGGNVATMSFDFRGLGYVMGYLAGKMSDTGTVGYVGAQKLKFYVDLQTGYSEGFNAARPDGQVLSVWTNDWDDVAKGKEAALNEIDQGADVIFPSMDNAVVGSLQAAKQRQKMAIGIYYDAINDWPNTVIQSAIFDVSGALEKLLSRAVQEGLDGKAYIYGLNSPKAARIGTYGEAVPDGVREAVNNIVDQIKDGKIDY